MDYLEYHYKMIESPVGRLKLVARDKSLVAILWRQDDPRRIRPSARRRTGCIPCSSRPNGS